MLTPKQMEKEKQVQYHTIRKIHKLIKIAMKLLLVAAIVV